MKVILFIAFALIACWEGNCLVLGSSSESGPDSCVGTTNKDDKDCPFYCDGSSSSSNVVAKTICEVVNFVEDLDFCPEQNQCCNECNNCYANCGVSRECCNTEFKACMQKATVNLGCVVNTAILTNPLSYSLPSCAIYGLTQAAGGCCNDCDKK